jgi:hypothetical protein
VTPAMPAAVYYVTFGSPVLLLLVPLWSDQTPAVHRTG